MAWLRQVYRETIRNERMFYYNDRLLAQMNAGVLTTIQDGATQEHYKTPHIAGVDLGSACVGVKLVGQLVHGVCTVIYLVPEWITDDANLASTLMLRSLEIAMEVSLFFAPPVHSAELPVHSAGGPRHVHLFFSFQVRKGKNLPPHAPTKTRMQLDGAPANWCAATFAFADLLVSRVLFRGTCRGSEGGDFPRAPTNVSC